MKHDNFILLWSEFPGIPQNSRSGPPDAWFKRPRNTRWILVRFWRTKECYLEQHTQQDFRFTGAPPAPPSDEDEFEGVEMPYQHQWRELPGNDELWSYFTFMTLWWSILIIVQMLWWKPFVAINWFGFSVFHTGLTLLSMIENILSRNTWTNTTKLTNSS